MNPTKITEEIVRIATTHGLSKDVIDLLEKKASLLQEELEQSKEREKKKDAEIAYLKSQLKDLEPAGFVESEGLLWKKKSDGSYERRPYCPECKSNPVMSQFPPGMNEMWVCPSGNHSFDGSTEPPNV